MSAKPPPPPCTTIELDDSGDDYLVVREDGLSVSIDHVEVGRPERATRIVLNAEARDQLYAALVVHRRRHPTR